MTRFLCIVLAFLAAPAFAQTFTWHVPTYGEGPDGSGLLAQSVAFDTADNAFVLQKFFDVSTPSVRLEKFARASGTVSWSEDFSAAESPSYQVAAGPAAIVSTGDDVYLAITDNVTINRGNLRRLNGADGSVAWQAAETADADTYYDALATDASGNAVVGGAFGIADGLAVAHAAKFNAADGTLLWHFEDDTDSCGTQSTVHADAVAVDANGDVVLVEQATSGVTPAYVFCVVKLQGDTGNKIWSQRFISADGIDITPQVPARLRLDASGNAVVSATYAEQYATAYGAVARFDATTGALLWKHDWQPAKSGQNGGLALDASGNVVYSLDTTQVFAAADGTPRWTTPAMGGVVGVASDGTIVLAHNVISYNGDAEIQFSALDAATGAAHWQTDLPLSTFEGWGPGNELYTDAAGAFVAVQTGWGQTTVVHAKASSGSNDWSKVDYVIGPAYAFIQPIYDGGFEHMMAKMPDGAVVVAGIVGLVGSSGNSGYGRWMVVKRSTTDGRLLWAAYGDPAQLDCAPKSVVVDAHGDAVVGVICSGDAMVFKISGGNGAVLWGTPPPSACAGAFSLSVSTDPATDVYSTQSCLDSSATQVTVKYSGSTGAQKWQQSAANVAALGPYNAFVRADTANGVIVANTSFNEIVVVKLRADTGAVSWTQELTAMFKLSTIAMFANNDPAIIGGNSVVVRLNSMNGQPRWSTPDNDLYITAAAIDAAGNLYTAGEYVLKFDGASGAQRWSKQLTAELRDVAIAKDGSVVVAGSGYLSGIAAYVATLEAATGVTRWALTDTAPGLAPDAQGVVVASDGGIIVSETTVSQWALTRISGSFTDDVFAGGFEP